MTKKYCMLYNSMVDKCKVKGCTFYPCNVENVSNKMKGIFEPMLPESDAKKAAERLFWNTVKVGRRDERRGY